MTIQHTCPSDVIQSLQIKLDKQRATCDRLRAELQQERCKTNTLTAQLLNLPTTDITPEQLAQAIIANCPRWRAVGLALVYHAMEMEESNEQHRLCQTDTAAIAGI